MDGIFNNYMMYNKSGMDEEATGSQSPRVHLPLIFMESLK